MILPPKTIFQAILLFFSISAASAVDAPVVLRQASSMAIAPAGPRVFFSALDTTTGHQLWCTDGTAPGTRMLTSLTGYISSSLAVTDQGNVIFSRWDTSGDSFLWISDGTVAGTRQINATLPSNTSLGVAKAAGSKVYFTLTRPKWGILVTDGTGAGTRVLKQFEGSLSNHNPIYLLGSTDQYFFFIFYNYDTGATPLQLWRSDGTPEGTIQLNAFKYIGDGVSGVPDASMCVSRGGIFYFPLCDWSDHWSFWQTDGTPTGTRQITYTPFYNKAIIYQYPVFFRDRLYYLGSDWNNYFYLYACNSTTTGTAVVTKLNAGYLGEPSFSDATENFMILNSNNRLIVSDGTAGGTRFVNITCGSSYYIRPFARLPRHPIWFCPGTDATHGTELWMTDGTDEGTKFIYELVPGKTSTEFRNLAVCGDRILAVTYVSSTMFNLWSMPVPEHLNAARQWMRYH